MVLDLVGYQMKLQVECFAALMHKNVATGQGLELVLVGALVEVVQAAVLEILEMVAVVPVVLVEIAAVVAVELLGLGLTQHTGRVELGFVLRVLEDCYLGQTFF